MGLFCGTKCHKRKMKRMEERTKRILGRQGTRESVRTSKWGAFDTAYQHGIDPRQSVATAVSDSVGFVSSIFGGGKKHPKSQGGDSGFLFIIGLVLAYFAFK